MEHKTYRDIKVAREDNIGAFEVGDYIYIQTKIDGANAAIRYDAENDCLVAQSRNRILDVGSDGLRGFYDYVQTLDKNKFKRILGENYILFGEWLVSHTVRYADDKYKKFYAFDIYDTDRETYLLQKDVYNIATELGLDVAKTLYVGTFISWDHVKSFLNQSCYGEVLEEGVVIKNQTKLIRGSSRDPAYLKIVNEQFKETQKQKKPKPEQNALYDENIAKTKEIVTERRVEKAIQKAQDEGELPMELSLENMGLVCKVIPKAVYADCIKEEPEAVNSIEEFSKFCAKVAIVHAKALLTRSSVSTTPPVEAG